MNPAVETIFQLYLLGRRARKQVQHHNEDVMLQMSVLWLITKGVTSPTDLGTALGISPSTMSEALTVLETTGFIEGESHESDRRRLVLNVTSKGIKQLNNISSMMGENCSSLFEKLTEPERQIFYMLANKLLD